MCHTHETQEICFFFGDVQTILLSFFENSNNLKVAKNAGAFLSRCIELLDQTNLLFPLHIELDLLRTLPNNKHYDGPNADGIPKLRRVLLAYSVHNPDVEYCQVS